MTRWATQILLLRGGFTGTCSIGTGAVRRPGSKASEDAFGRCCREASQEVLGVAPRAES